VQGTVRFRTTFRNTIYDVLRARGWRETDSDTEWDVAWVDVGWIRDNMDAMHFEEHQRINHFRNHFELTRKDCMNKNLRRTQRQLQREDKHDEARKYDFFPNTYVLPFDYGMFVEEFKTQAGAVWIMKPIGKAQGKGIFLFNKLSQINDWKQDNRWKPDNPQAETYVVQRYIENPLLIGGKKFDLRIYALVTSFNPLVCYLYRSGFARFTGFRYSSNTKTLSESYMHLTNVAVQKTAPGYDAGAGCKWPLRQLKLYLISKFGVQVTDRLFNEMQELIINSLISVQKVMINDKHAFEMYGYDIMIDEALKPWLIEINSSPSLTADTPTDYELKFGLLDDLYTVIDVENKLGGALEESIGGFDLIYNNGPVKPDRNSCYGTRLGCFDDRIRNLKRMHKTHARRATAGAAGVLAAPGSEK
jgi:tubulin polyglutamylase TTLL9